MRRSRNLQRVIVNQLEFLLDQFSGAVGAYSLRYLISSFTGDVILVRRASDDSEQGFTPIEISDGTLESFCGAGDGFVKAWHDQTGNGSGATQITTTAQPKIVHAGSLVTENGKPALHFDGVNDYLSANSLSSILSGQDKPISTYGVTKGVVGSYVSFGNNTSNTPLWIQEYRSQSELRYLRRDDSGTIFIHDQAASALDQILWATNDNSTKVDMHVNGKSIGSGLNSNVGNTTFNTFSLGAISRTALESFFQGVIQELVVFPSDQSNNRSEIETNINDYYGIF